MGIERRHGTVAIRVRTLSARLVRMIGTRAPSTIPAASALARKVSLFEHVASLEVGDDQDVGIAGDGEVMSLMAAASRLIASSNARGPSEHPRR